MNLTGEIKRLLPHRLLWRSVLILMVPLIMVPVIGTIVFYNNHWEVVTRRLAYSVGGDIAVLMVMLKEDTSPEHWDDVRDLALTHLSLNLSFEPGAILPNRVPPMRDTMTDRWLQAALTDQLRKPFVFDTDWSEREVEIKVQLPDGVLRVLAPKKRLSSVTTYIVVLWMIGTSAVLAVVAMLFMRNQVRPIRRLAQAAESFGKGRDVPNYRPAGATEVRQAAAAFIQMRDRIKRQIAQRTDMLSGVSHDLRTPLTRMKLQLAMLGDSPEIADLKTDIGEMERMIEGYLAFVRGEGHETPTKTDLAPLLNEIVDGARRQGAAIALETQGDLQVEVRPNALKRSLTNLVTNATRYGKKVAVRAVRQDEAIEITVIDDGPGIPAAKREDVFRPFVRLESSRNKATGGIGLGLTIARDIIRGHGGDIVLQDAPGGGLKASVRLPL